jgi:SAM-dependent methyltransferase
MRCRHCGTPLQRTLIDLGMSPLCESFLTKEQLDEPEAYYPLHTRVCHHCWLVQLPAFVSPAHIFTEYAYFSSFSTTWVEHAGRYCGMIKKRLGLGTKSFVVELGSNDGYLLKHFVGLGVPVLGIEPAANVAEEAQKAGVPTLNAFFGRETAGEVVAERGHADLIVANNVLAQVPELNDFIAGMAHLVAPEGVITIEVPHLERLMDENQFDTIYHEHFSYFSLLTTCKIFEAHGLTIFDVEEIPTHGGSLRIYARHAGDDSKPIDDRVRELLDREVREGFRRIETYTTFRQHAETTKWRLVEFLIDAKRLGKSIVGYGAPGKGNTLLNFCGIRTDFLDYTVDRNPHKHGRFTPGTHIPIHAPDRHHVGSACGSSFE